MSHQIVVLYYNFPVADTAIALLPALNITPKIFMIIGPLINIICSIETVCISLYYVIHTLLNRGGEGVKQHDYINTGGNAGGPKWPKKDYLIYI